MKAICRLSSPSTSLTLRMAVVVVSRQNAAVDGNKRKKNSTEEDDSDMDGEEGEVAGEVTGE